MSTSVSPQLPSGTARPTMRRMTTVRSAALAGLLVALCWTASATGQTPDATLPSQCLDQQVAPVSVTLTCADGGFIAHDLVWSDWGAAQAHATGTATVNTCDPNCAHGNAKDYAVALIADQLSICSFGKPQYTLVRYSFPNGGPFPTTDKSTFSFPCPKRPHANPRIKSLRMSFSTRRASGGRYSIRANVALRVCAVRGRSTALFNETKRLGGQTFGAHSHLIRFRQSSACQSHRFRWTLRDDVIGVGVYRVAAQVTDADLQFSKTVSRKSTTTD
jgi:hypothetical protein